MAFLHHLACTNAVDAFEIWRLRQRLKRQQT